MTRDSDRCPEPEVLAAFVAGNATGAELEMITDHVLGCEDCRPVVRDAAQYDRSNATGKYVARTAPARRPVWWLSAAAAVFGIVALSTWYATRDSDPWITALAKATPRDARFIEPRLTGGFTWAPLKADRSARGEPSDPARLKLSGVAGDVLEATGGDRSASARHAAGLARLLAGDSRAATLTLEECAARSRDARVWSDLAATRFQLAVETEDAQQLAQALAAVDEALRHNPRLAEALFNRALILEHLGLRDQARRAWQSFLDVDPRSPWAGEARTHMRRLEPVTDFRRELEQHYGEVARDMSSASSLVARFPQETRVWGESEILSRWAREVLAGNAAGAELHFAVAQHLGDALCARGECMLRDAASAIASATAQRRQQFATAHAEFREAQKAFRAAGAGVAEPRFRNAVSLFQAANSPMQLAARYFAANTAFDNGRVQQASDELNSLAHERSARYPALGAGIDWELGLVYSALGRWGKAMHAFEESIASFERLGETSYSMTVRELLAEVYDRIGESRTAWNYRITALQNLGRRDDLRLRTTLHAIARGAALTRDWQVAHSFIDLQTEPPHHPGDEFMRVNALLTRARIRAENGSHSDALADYERATIVLNRVTDPAARDRAEAERIATEALLASVPSRAIALLSGAIDFHRTKGHRMYLPNMLLQRGRAFLASGAKTRAADDFDTGIREIETQRDSISDADRRWGIFGSADHLFSDAAALALQRNDGAAALAYCDRGRGREFARVAAAATPQSDHAKFDGVVVEYLLLPHRLVIFVVDHGTTRTVQHSIDESLLDTQVALLADSAKAGDDARFRLLCRSLYEYLIAPFDDELRGNRMLVVVPDPALEGVPFPALIDREGRHVIEKHAVVVAPSLAAFRQLVAHKRASVPISRLLIVAGPAAPKGSTTSLTAASAEAQAIAAMYPESETVALRADSAEVLEARAADADIIHFVGHATVPSRSSAGALITSRDGLIAQMHVREIATMRLTRPRVVVLAACSTGRAFGRTGEASISIARAFLAAGAPAVVATLWPIEDGQAAEFFPRIHWFLSRGMPPAEAIRAAQLEWVHRRDAPPAMWAAVEVIGL